MIEKESALTLDEQLQKLGLQVTRPSNIDTSNNSIESLAQALEKRAHQSEDYVLNEMAEYLGNPLNQGNIEIPILLDGSLVFFINLLNKIKVNPYLEQFLNRINFRYVFKTGNGGMTTLCPVEGDENTVRFPIDDIWDTGLTAGLPLAIQLGMHKIKFYTYSRKVSSPTIVSNEDFENAAEIATPDDQLAIFDDEWIYTYGGMNSSKFKNDPEVNMFERMCSIPLMELNNGSFDIDNRDEYLKLLKSLRVRRNGDEIESIFARLANSSNKIEEMLLIHNELVGRTNMQKFNIIEG